MIINTPEQADDLVERVVQVLATSTWADGTPIVTASAATLHRRLRRDLTALVRPGHTRPRPIRKAVVSRPTSGDRLLAIVTAEIESSPELWPTRSAFSALEHHDQERLPHGLLLDQDQPSDEHLVWVLSPFWAALCRSASIDSSAACRDLHARGILQRTPSSRRASVWTTAVQVPWDGQRRKMKAYVLQLSIEGRR